MKMVPPVTPFVGLPLVEGCYVIYETQNVQYLIKTIKFVKLRKFKLDDHQFSLTGRIKDTDQRDTFLSKEDGKPLILDCLEGIDKSIYNVLVRLRDFYNERNAGKEERERTYVFVCHKQLDTAIIVGNFHLHKEDLGRIARICTTRLFEFLNSGTYVHLALRMDDSLQVRFVTIGEKRIKSKKRKGPFEPRSYIDADIVGAGRNRTCEFNWLTLAPLGTRRNSTAFKGQCLLVSVILGNLINRAREATATKAEKRQINYFFKHPAEPMSDQLAGLITWTITELRFHLNIVEPIKMGLCVQLARHFKSQIVIFNDQSPPSVVAIYPKEAQLSLKPIYLHLVKQKEENKYHVDVIKDVNMFYNTRGFACISCKFKTKYYRNLRHSCRNKLTESCFACHRTLLKKDTYVNDNIEKLFCDSQLKNNYGSQRCQACGVFFYSNSCRLAHTAGFCLHKGFTCKKCDKFIFGLRSQDKIDAHVCRWHKMCRFCKEEMPAGHLHLCPWASPIPSKNLDNLAFVHFTYSSSNAQCSRCFDSANSNCELHPFGTEREIFPVLCNFLFEEGVHGKFSQIDLYDPMFLKKSELQEQALSFDYLPPSLKPELFKTRQTFAFKKPKSKDPQLESALVKLREKTNKNVTEAFLASILCSAYQNYCFVVTEGKAINQMIKAMVYNDIIPKRPLVKGAQAILLQVPYYGIRLVCLTQFLSGSCSDLIKQYDLTTEELFFPNLLPFDPQKVKQFSPGAPDFALYAEIMDSKKTQEQKRVYWNRIRDVPFNYLSALEEVAKREFYIKTMAALHFVKMSLEFQNQCCTFFGRPAHLKDDSLPIVPAFKYVSMSSFMKNTFRTFALEKDTLFIVKDQYGKRIAGSQPELEATEFLRCKEPNTWITEYSGSGGQKKFFINGKTSPLAIADAYNPQTKTALFVNGCYFHGHSGCNTISPKEQESTEYQEKYERFCRQTKQLLFQCSNQISNVLVLWECEFNALKNGSAKTVLPPPFEQLKLSNTELLNFLAGPKLRPFQKMVVRDAFSAALNETYALKYIHQPTDGKKCWILDVSSLYPYVATHFPMPHGKYFTLIGDELTNTAITFDAKGEQMLLDGLEVIAIVHCRVYPPSNLHLPFLQTEINKLTVGTLCRTCSELAQVSSVVVLCTHSEMERSFISTLSSYEIAYASQLGYHFDFYEMIVYREASFFLRPFLTLLAYQKLRHSDWPKEVNTPELQAAYCRELNKSMDFLNIIQTELSPEVMQPNPGLRAFFKSCLNFLLGTFGANNQKYTHVEFLKHYEQLLDYMQQDRLVHIIPLTDQILQVTLKVKDSWPSRTSNVSVSVAITSLARVVMHKHMCTVEKLGGTLLRVSCDCIYFLMDRSIVLPFSFGESLGCFKQQFSHVRGVVQLGLRNLSILYEQNFKLVEHLVVSGVMLSSYNSEILTHLNYQEEVENLFKDTTPKDKKALCCVQLFASIQKMEIKSIPRSQEPFLSQIYKRRQFLSSDPFFGSVPFGITKL